MNRWLLSGIPVYRLKDQIFAMEQAKEQHERHIRDLSIQIQRYVNEVKRVEELLAHREKERSELLQQYKSLSVEIDNSETLNRSLEAKVRRQGNSCFWVVKYFS